MSLRLADTYVLVDTSFWVDHFRRDSEQLRSWLRSERVLVHDFVLGELTLGTLPRGHAAHSQLLLAPRAVHATHDEAMAFVRQHRLEGAGIGWIDAHLLLSAVMSRAVLKTLDKRLALAARAVGAVDE